MPITWEGGRTLHQITRNLEDERDAFVGEVKIALARATEYGAAQLQDFLEKATTDTGERRVEKGGVSAGRHRSGNMVASVSNNNDNLSEEGQATYGAFGWFAGEFEEYFKEQDLGLGAIPPAHAMFDAMNNAKAYYIGLLNEIIDRRNAI